MWFVFYCTAFIGHIMCQWKLIDKKKKHKLIKLFIIMTDGYEPPHLVSVSSVEKQGGLVNLTHMMVM